jgi:Sperm-tail PG-rich repeat
MHLYASPAWTFKGKVEEKIKFKAPGPGNYNPSVKILSQYETSPNYKIGTSSRDKLITSNVPGPGTYTSTDVRPHSLAPVTGSSKRPPLSDNGENPGPGTYEIPQRAVEGPKFSMKGRIEKANPDNSPGPGHYEHAANDYTTKERAPTYRMGSASRTDRPQSGYVPGPGNYETRGKEAGPKWGFGTETRDKNFKLESPGPGTYEIPNTLAKTSYSIAGRKPEAYRDNFPGPGSYNPSARPKSPSWSMGKTARLDFGSLVKGVPGPGTYSPKSEFRKSGPVFGTSSRPPLSSVKDTPGPGEYGNKYPKDSPAYTMRPKTGVKKTNNVPGPGHYDPKIDQGDPKWTVGKDKKGLDYNLSKSASMPGPGFYKLRKDPEGPKWKFGTSSRSKELKSSVPGPGQYDFYSSISNLPAYVAL